MLYLGYTKRDVRYFICCQSTSCKRVWFISRQSFPRQISPSIISKLSVLGNYLSGKWTRPILFIYEFYWF